MKTIEPVEDQHVSIEQLFIQFDEYRAAKQKMINLLVIVTSFNAFLHTPGNRNVQDVFVEYFSLTFLTVTGTIYVIELILNLRIFLQSVLLTVKYVEDGKAMVLFIVSGSKPMQNTVFFYFRKDYKKTLVFTGFQVFRRRYWI